MGKPLSLCIKPLPIFTQANIPFPHSNLPFPTLTTLSLSNFCCLSSIRISSASTCLSFIPHHLRFSLFVSLILKRITFHVTIVCNPTPALFSASHPFFLQHFSRISCSILPFSPVSDGDESPTKLFVIYTPTCLGSNPFRYRPSPLKRTLCRPMLLFWMRFRAWYPVPHRSRCGMNMYVNPPPVWRDPTGSPSALTRESGS